MLALSVEMVRTPCVIDGNGSSGCCDDHPLRGCVLAVRGQPELHCWTAWLLKERLRSTDQKEGNKDNRPTEERERKRRTSNTV